MADEEIASLIVIEDGDLAKAKPLRQNFNYLDNRITSQSTLISNKETLSHKGVANGYCPLDNNGKVSTTYLSTLLGAIYPVGGVYITTVDSETCPIASLIPNSTWEKVASGRVLQGADEEHEAGTTIAAGLPNITGTIRPYAQWGGWGGGYETGVSGWSGALTYIDSGTTTNRAETGGGYKGIRLDASLSSSVYRDDCDTVQPSAYVVVIWRRTA